MSINRRELLVGAVSALPLLDPRLRALARVVPKGARSESETIPTTKEHWFYGFGPLDGLESMVVLPQESGHEPYVLAVGGLDWAPTSDPMIPFSFQSRGLAISQGFTGEPSLILKESNKDILDSRVLDGGPVDNGNRLLLLETHRATARDPNTNQITETIHEVSMFTVDPKGSIKTVDINSGPLQFNGRVSSSFSDAHHMIHGYEYEVEADGQKQRYLEWVDISDPKNPKVVKKVRPETYGPITSSPDGSVTLFNGNFVNHINGPDFLPQTVPDRMVFVPNGRTINGRNFSISYSYSLYNPDESIKEIIPGVYALQAFSRPYDGTPADTESMIALFDATTPGQYGYGVFRLIPIVHDDKVGGITVIDGQLVRLLHDRVVILKGNHSSDVYPRVMAQRPPQEQYYNEPFPSYGLFTTGNPQQIGYIAQSSRKENGIPRTSWVIIDFPDTTSLSWPQGFFPSIHNNS